MQEENPEVIAADFSAYRHSAEEVIAHLKSSSKGLDKQEAAARLLTYGTNILKRDKGHSMALALLRQFKDFMILLLIVSVFISWFIGDSRTAIILVFVVMINTAIGFSQEYKAEKTMASLEKLVVPQAKVLRGDSLVEIPSAEIVPGDIIYIEEGDFVPADARVIEETTLSTNDFALTGESNPSRKFTHEISDDVVLADRHNLIFMGTTVATGHGHAVVIGTGMNTELGRIAHLSQESKSEASPLQKEMTNLAATITKAVIIIGILIAPLAWLANNGGSGGLKSLFIFIIGVASALIPQGLPAEVNTALASAAGKLAKAKALVRKLSAVETLGATSLILTDKTGTLTKNEMTVQYVYAGFTNYQVSGSGYEGIGQILGSNKKPLSPDQLLELDTALYSGVFASNASIHPPDDKHATWYCLGDPTEGALITLARKANLIPSKINDEHPELKEFPFDSARKRMSSIREFRGNLTVFVKGAPESVLEKCTMIWDGKKTRKITSSDKSKIQDLANIWAADALRNLSFATKTLKPGTRIGSLKMEEAESELTFYSLVGMIDPPREEVPAAMIAAREAFIPVSIVTGDNALTARAIAQRAGLAKNIKELKTVTGEELTKMEDHEIGELITGGQVIFSRVAPEDKLRIVDIAKRLHRVVAVTGDGINDAPALKRADIGVAMGRTGTDVAKDASEIVLLDDSFKTLIDAVGFGRTIYQNIVKASLSCLTTNSAELVVVIVSLIASLWLKIPLGITAVQILAIDLVAELFPIAALGWDKSSGDIMQDHPRDLNSHILNRHSLTDLALAGILMGGLGYINFLLYFWRHGLNPKHMATSASAYLVATTLTYVTICLCQFGNILLRRLRHDGKLFSRYLFSNGHLNFAFGMSLSAMVLLIYVPVLQRYMGYGNLNLSDWLFAFIAAAIFMTVRRKLAK